MAGVSVRNDGEVSGRVLRSIVDASGEVSSVFEERTRAILAEHGLEDVRGDEWYPLEDCLDTLADIEDTIGPQTLTSTGKNTPENAEWPPDVDSIDEGLASVDEAYRMNHRGDDIGSYEYEAVGETEARMTCRNPYPCHFDRGLITGVAEKFSSDGTLVDVEETSETCRSDGDEKCVYRVSWH